MGALNYKDLETAILNYDLAIVASKNDPCSNFLIECINKDLDVLALNSGGHKELIKNKSCLFETQSELIDKISNYQVGNYKNINKFDINKVTTKYISLCKAMVRSSIIKKNKISSDFTYYHFYYFNKIKI